MKQTIECLLQNDDQLTNTKCDSATQINNVAQAESSVDQQSSTIQALVWIHRVLYYLELVLTDICNDYDDKVDDENIEHYFKSAFDKVFASCQTWLMQMMFSLVVMTIPSRSKLL